MAVNKLAKFMKIEMLETYTYWKGLGNNDKFCIQQATGKWTYEDNDRMVVLLKKLIEKNKEVIEEEKNKFFINRNRFTV